MSSENAFFHPVKASQLIFMFMFTVISQTNTQQLTLKRNQYHVEQSGEKAHSNSTQMDTE